MNPPRVSIVVPSWQQGRFLGDCVASILGQDYENVEVLVFDNCSDDGSADVLRQFADPRVRVVIERDRGQADAIRRGLDAATGELFGWLNADDYLAPRAIRSVVDAAHQIRNAAVYYGLVALVDASRRLVQVCVPGDVTRAGLLDGSSGVLQPGSLYPTSLVRRVGGINPRFRMCMDLDLWLRLLEHGEAVLLPQVLAFMRVHEQAKTFRLPLLNATEHLSVVLTRGAPVRAVPKLLLLLTVAGLKQVGLRRPPVLRKAHGAERTGRFLVCHAPAPGRRLDRDQA